MSPAQTQIPLSRAIDIPFDKLVLSPSNVRQVNTGLSLDELREDIARRGLLQSLNVRPLLDAKGVDTGKYEVPAGGRRFRALEQLVKARRLPKTALIPCVLRGSSDTSLEDDSLAENTQRLSLHPLDQYRAFLALHRQNMSEEDIAARYFVSVQIVRQRLRLAAVSPELLDLYAKDEMTLEQLMAFSITGDHDRQMKVWEAAQNLHAWQRGAREIRNLLTESAVAADDRRAIFVSLEAYEAAGGTTLRDLFCADSGGWLQDPVLLDRLVDDKLNAVAKGLAHEGWKWIEVLASLPFDHMHGLRKLQPTGSSLTEADQASLASSRAELGALSETWADHDTVPDAINDRFTALEAEIDALLRSDHGTFDPVDVARAGVVICLGRDGQAQIMRGYVRPEDEAPLEATAEANEDAGTNGGSAQPALETAIITLGGSGAPPVEGGEDDESDLLRPLPEKLVMELTVYRTIALREALACNPNVAMTLLLHKLVSDTFQHRYGGACLQVMVSAPQVHNITPKGLNDSPPAMAMERRRDLWAETIPGDDQALWDWLGAQSDAVREELLAFCISYGLNAVMERPNPYGAGPTQQGIDTRLSQAKRLAHATGLDLIAMGWRPTADTYLGRVPRPRILEAVREGCGEREAQLIAHLKKTDMVVEAARLLADAGWLPEVLRARSGEGAVVEDASDIALPAFLDQAADGCAEAAAE